MLCPASSNMRDKVGPGPQPKSSPCDWGGTLSSIGEQTRDKKRR
ncbi:Uncharacterised protein [Vibrio cholerae]|nr:Uncharacterised protein [Vibrio cholerae]